MKKHIFRTLFVLATCFLVFSCYEDKGSYDYNWTPQVAVTFENNTIMVKAGAELRIEPTLRTVVVESYNQFDTLATFSNPNDYTYDWKVYRGIELMAEWGDERVLETTADLAISSAAYTVVLTVAEKETGTQWTGTCNLRVSDAFYKGLVMLYEDEEGSADIDIYGTTPENDYHYQRNVLSTSDFPYRGAPQFVVFEPYSSFSMARIWVGTDDETCFLSTPTFGWQDNYLASLLRVEGKDDDFYYSKAAFAWGNSSQALYFIGNNGELSYKGRSIIFASKNLLHIDGQYQNVEFAPYIAGSNGSQCMWDKTNKRLMKISVNGLASAHGSEAVEALSGNNALSGYELVYMRSVAASKFSGIYRNTSGKYTYVTHEQSVSVVNGGIAFAWDITSSWVYPDAMQATFANASIVEFSNGTTPATYVYSDGKLYVAKENSLAETNVELKAGETITKLKVINADGSAPNNEYLDKFMVAIWNESAQTGRLCIYTTDYVNPESLVLHDEIEDTPKILDITNFY